MSLEHGNTDDRNSINSHWIIITIIKLPESIYNLESMLSTHNLAHNIFYVESI